jgi:hypothetical protein
LKNLHLVLFRRHLGITLGRERVLAVADIQRDHGS